MKTLILAFSMLSTSPVFAAADHTGFCRYGEVCDEIVSQSLREAERICKRQVFETVPKRVYQEQRDGSIIFIGYTCVAAPSA